MKLLRLVLSILTLHLAALCGIVAFTGCTTPPAERQAAAITLKIVGLTAKAGIDSAALMLREGQLTPEQWSRIAGFYDLRFQPAYQLAVATARADLNSPADPQLLALAEQFSALLPSELKR